MSPFDSGGVYAYAVQPTDSPWCPQQPGVVPLIVPQPVYTTQPDETAQLIRGLELRIDALATRCHDLEKTASLHEQRINATQLTTGDAERELGNRIDALSQRLDKHSLAYIVLWPNGFVRGPMSRAAAELVANRTAEQVLIMRLVPDGDAWQWEAVSGG